MFKTGSRNFDVNNLIKRYNFDLLQRISMYLLLTYLLMFRTLKASDIVTNICDGVVFEHQYYEKQMLFESLSAPTNLIMHMYTGEIFFSHTVHEGSKPDFVIRVCNIDNRICKDLTEVAGGVAISYDPIHHDVFLGGRDGIYKYNRTTQTAHFVAERGKQIWHIFIHEYLYYIESSTKKLLVHKQGKFTPVEQFENKQIDNIFISRIRSVYFSNKTALYKCDTMNKTAHPIFKFGTIRQIIQHHKSNTIYFTASDGIYYTQDTATRKTKLKKAADINQVFGMAFRNTTESKYEPLQIIYSDKNSIYKLTSSNQSEANKKICLSKSKELNHIARQKKEAKRKTKEVHKGTALRKFTRIVMAPHAQRMMFAIA